MSTNELLICNLQQLKTSNSFTKFFDELRDEVVVYVDDKSQAKCFSSVCPHLAGEVVLDEKTKGFRCKWHGLIFDTSGNSTNCKARLSLGEYKTFIRGEGVYINYEL